MVGLLTNKGGVVDGNLTIHGKIHQSSYSIGPNINMNTITASGWYYTSEGSNYTNGPSTYLNGVLEVINFGANTVIQRYTRYDGTTHQRMAWYGTWYAWKQLSN